MIATRPEADPTAYYTTNETAALLGVERHSVRRYLVGKIRKCNGRRYFSGKEILELWEDFNELNGPEAQK